MRRFKVGDVVRIQNYDISQGYAVRGQHFDGIVGTVRYTNTQGNLYYVGNFPDKPYASLMNVRRENMVLLPADEYPELYI